MIADGRPTGYTLTDNHDSVAHSPTAGQAIRFPIGLALQVMVVDRTPVPTHRRDANAWAILYLYDLEGRELWRRQMEKGEWGIATRLIQWQGPGKQECALVYGFSVERQGPAKPACIYDGQGEFLDALPLQVAPLSGETNYRSDCYGMAADVWGDSREEVILFGSGGFCVYANTRPLEKPYALQHECLPGHVDDHGKGLFWSAKLPINAPDLAGNAAAGAAAEGQGPTHSPGAPLPPPAQRNSSNG
jgi:hypothetical protein